MQNLYLAPSPWAVDVELSGASDEKLLEWAADHGRILLTHDARTMPRHVYDRLKTGAHVPGVLIVDDRARIGDCIDDLLLVAECSEAGEWRDRIFYLPVLITRKPEKPSERPYAAAWRSFS